MPHTYSAGQTIVPNQWCDYFKDGVLRFHELQPAVLGTLLASSYVRAPSVSNPINSDGWREPSNYFGTLAKYEMKWCAYNHSTYACTNSFLAPIPALAGLPGSFPTLCENDLARARNKALLQLKDQTVNLSLAFKERQQTVDLIAGAVKKAAGIVKNVKKVLRNPQRKRALHSRLKGKWKDAPESWLLYRYGIVPTMLDVYGAAEALEKRDNGTYNRYMLTVRGKSTTVLKPKLVSHTVGYFGRYWLVPDVVTDQYMLGSKYGARVRYDAALTNATYLRLSEVGVTNPLEVAWEAVTFSFVADWFLSIGDWCSALDATLPYTFVGGSETIFVEWSGETRVIHPSVRVISDSGPATFKQFDRRAVGSFPFASPFVLKQNPFNFTRLADALSLIASFAKTDPHIPWTRPVKTHSNLGIPNGS